MLRYDLEHDMSHAVKDASLVLILSDHSEFKNLSDSHFDKMDICVLKNVVKSSFEDVLYYNYGNIDFYQQNKMCQTRHCYVDFK